MTLRQVYSAVFYSRTSWLVFGILYFLAHFIPNHGTQFDRVMDVVFLWCSGYNIARWAHWAPYVHEATPVPKE